MLVIFTNIFQFIKNTILIFFKTESLTLFLKSVKLDSNNLKGEFYGNQKNE